MTDAKALGIEGKRGIQWHEDMFKKSGIRVVKQIPQAVTWRSYLILK